MQNSSALRKVIASLALCDHPRFEDIAMLSLLAILLPFSHEPILPAGLFVFLRQLGAVSAHHTAGLGILPM